MFTKQDLPDIELRENKAALHAAWMAAVDFENTLDDGATDADVEKAKAATKAAEDAFEEVEAPVLMEDYDGNHMCCSACDAPLWDDDETVVDQVTDQVYLRVAIGLQPREEKQELPDVVQGEAAE